MPSARISPAAATRARPARCPGPSATPPSSAAPPVAFARSGYAATSMEEIAAASGITKLIVYRHFDSKEELYRAVLQRVFDRLAEEFLTGYSRRPRGRRGRGPRRCSRVARVRTRPAFELLWRHAAREPQFAEYASELRDHAVDASAARCSSSGSTRRCASGRPRRSSGYLVEATAQLARVRRPRIATQRVHRARDRRGAGRDRRLVELAEARRLRPRRGTRPRRAARWSSPHAAMRSPPRAGRGVGSRVVIRWSVRPGLHRDPHPALSMCRAAKRITS